MSAIATGALCVKAWFVAEEAGVNKGTSVPTGTLSVEDNSANLGDVYVNVIWGSAPTDKVVYTGTDGKTAYYAGTADPAHLISDITVASPYAQFATYPFTVILSTSSGGNTLPSAQALTSVAGDHTITFTATGEVKISTTSGADAVTKSAANTATFTITIDPADDEDGLSAGASGNVYYGFAGIAEEQDGDGGTITVASVA